MWMACTHAHARTCTQSGLSCEEFPLKTDALDTQVNHNKLAIIIEAISIYITTTTYTNLHTYIGG